jgi:hypothetical protein
MSQLRKTNVTPVFEANLNAYKAGYPVICNEGGSRSSKSYSIVQLLVSIAVNDNFDEITARATQLINTIAALNSQVAQAEAASNTAVDVADQINREALARGRR